MKKYFLSDFSCQGIGTIRESRPLKTTTWFSRRRIYTDFGVMGVWDHCSIIILLVYLRELGTERFPVHILVEKLDLWESR